MQMHEYHNTYQIIGAPAPRILVFKIEKHGFTETKKIDFKLDEQNFEKAGVLAKQEHAHHLRQKAKHLVDGDASNAANL